MKRGVSRIFWIMTFLLLCCPTPRGFMSREARRDAGGVSYSFTSNVRARRSSIPSASAIRARTYRSYSAPTTSARVDHGDSSPRVINKVITSTFAEGNNSAAALQELRAYLHANVHRMNHVNAVTLMHRCTKSKKLVIDYLPPEDLTRLLSSGTLSSQGIANTLYSLHSITSMENSNTTLIEELLIIISSALDSNREKFDSQSLSNSFYGLRGLRLQGDESKSNPLLRVMTGLAMKLDDNFEETAENELVPTNFMSPQGIGNAVLGLQGMSTATSVVRVALSRFNSYIKHSTKPMDGQSIASIMIGLRSCKSDSPEVVGLLRSLISTIREKKGRMNIKSREVSMILCGMQSMSCSYEVSSLLNATVSIAWRKNIWLQNGDEIASALTGLKTMGSENPASRSAMVYIAESLTRSRRRLHQSAQQTMQKVEYYKDLGRERAVPPETEYPTNEFHIATCFFAMQNMGLLYQETDTLLRVLTTALKDNVKGVLREESVAKIMYGLQSIHTPHVVSDGKAVRAILRVIASKIDQNSSTYSAQHVTMITYGLKSMSSASGEVRRLLIVLKPLIMCSPECTSELLLNHQFASALYGMQGLSSAEPSVRAYLEAILSRVPNGNEGHQNFNGQELGMACHGMRLMSNHWLVVRNCMHAVTLRLDNILAVQPSEISMAIHGMQGMRGNSVSSNSSQLGSDIAYNLSGVGFDGFNVVEGLGIVSTQPLWVIDNDGDGWIPVSTEMPLKDNSKIMSMLGSSRAGMDSPHLSKSLIKLLGKLGDIMRKRREHLNSSQIGLALYGLRGMNTNCVERVEVESILECIAEDIEASLTADPPSFDDCRSIASAFFGLQKMSADSPVVRRVLGQLAAALGMYTEINGQTVGNILFGMQGMSSDVPEVRRVLTHLTEKINGTPNLGMNGQNFGNALYGLKSMSSDCVEVRDLLRAIVHKMHNSSSEMTGQNIGNALYGMQGMSESHVEVREVLSRMAHQVMMSQSKLSGLDIGMSLYGLRSMDSNNSAEVTILLGLLIQKIKSDPNLDMRLGELSLAIIGILQASPWIRDDFLETLALKTTGMQYIAAVTKGVHS